MLIHVAHFFAGAFLINALPHLINGLSGQPFPTPFAKPPGKGLSSPVVNVLWAAFNLAVGTLLMTQTAGGTVLTITDAGVAVAGGLLISLGLASHFGKVFAGTVRR